MTAEITNFGDKQSIARVRTGWAPASIYIYCCCKFSWSSHQPCRVCLRTAEEVCSWNTVLYW